MSGEQGSGVYIDQSGQIYHQSPPMTTAQRWASIGLQALVGAGRGLAAGQGAGGAGRALSAGAETGFQMRQASDKQKTEEAEKSWEMQRETRKDNAELQMQQAKIAQMTLENTRTNQLMTDDQIKLTNEQKKFVTDNHGYLLGDGRIYTSKDYHEMVSDDPTVLKQHFGTSNVIPIPVYDPETHQTVGMQIGIVPPDTFAQPVPPGTTVPKFIATPEKGPGAYRTEDVPLAQGSTFFQQQQAVNDYFKSVGEAQKQQKGVFEVQEAQGKAQTATAQGALAGPQAAATLEETRAKGAEARSAAAKNDAERVLLNTTNDQTVISNNAQQLVEGTMDPSNLSKRSKTYDPTLAAANAYSMRKYGVPFDLAKAAGDYKYATNTGFVNTMRFMNALVGTDNMSGNLGVLVNQSDSIKRTQFPALNDVAAWARLQTGDPAMAAYHTTVTLVADEVAKILQGGGTGNATSDAKLQQAQRLFNEGFSKKQIQAVGNDSRQLIANRKHEMIIGNRYAERWYGPQGQGPPAPGSETATPPGQTGAGAAGAGAAAGAAPPLSMLTEGKTSHFDNGQDWTLKNGQPTRLK